MEERKKSSNEETIQTEVLSDEEAAHVSGGQSTGMNEDVVVCSKCGHSFPKSDTRDGLCHDCWFQSQWHGFGMSGIPKLP